MRLEENRANLEFLADRDQIKKESRIEYNPKKGFFINPELPLYLYTFKKQKIQYLNIQKNASSTVRFFLSEQIRKDINKVLFPRKFSYKTFVIIRDPIKRFISACKIPFSVIDYFYYPKHPDFNQVFLLKEYIFKYFDKLYKYNFKVFAHLCPQNAYMQGLKPDKIFKMEERKFVKYLEKKFKAKMNERNVSDNSLTLKDITPNELDFLFDFYDEDYRFLKDFYTKDKLYKEWKRLS